MGIDILNLQPTSVSRDLKGKFVCVYGSPGSGKTTLAASFPKNLLLGFEVGWNALSNIYAVPVHSWMEFKQIIKQLKKSEAKEKYHTVSIDTIGLAWDKCVDYICDKNGVDKIGDIPYGAGYAEAKKEFENCIIEITQEGYGIVIIAHADVHMEADPSNENAEIRVMGPALPKKAYDVINRLVDIIAYIDTDKDGNRWLYLRGTPTIAAKSRFAYTPPRIPMGYDNLVNAIAEAIEEEAKHGGKVVDTPSTPRVGKKQKVDFDKLVSDIRDHASIMRSLKADKEYTKIIEEYLGKGKKVMECDESQTDMLILILDDLKDWAEEHKEEIDALPADEEE